MRGPWPKILYPRREADVQLHLLRAHRQGRASWWHQIWETFMPPLRCLYTYEEVIEPPSRSRTSQDMPSPTHLVHPCKVCTLLMGTHPVVVPTPHTSLQAS